MKRYLSPPASGRPGAIPQWHGRGNVHQRTGKERYAKPAASAGFLGLRERSVQVSGQQPQRVFCITRTFA
jgi:hypothetical protein